jgi:beta-phosphoglucomutase
MIKLIVFDLDGVLVDTEETHINCLSAACIKITGIKEISKFLPTDGRTTRDKLLILQDRLHLSKEELKLIDSIKQQMVIDSFSTGIKHSPGIKTMLTELSQKYKLAIASNSRKENVFNILNNVDIVRYFSLIITGSDIDRPKPDKEIFVKTMELFDVGPESTLILEDSEAGKYAARMSLAHLLEIDNINNVTLELIENEISRIEDKCCNTDGRRRISV